MAGIMVTVVTTAVTGIASTSVTTSMVVIAAMVGTVTVAMGITMDIPMMRNTMVDAVNMDNT